MGASPPLPPLYFVAALVYGHFVTAPPTPAGTPVPVEASVGVQFAVACFFDPAAFLVSVFCLISDISCWGVLMFLLS